MKYKIITYLLKGKKFINCFGGLNKKMYMKKTIRNYLNNTKMDKYIFLKKNCFGGVCRGS